MKKKRRFRIIWWGFSTFRFRKTRYLPNFPIFDSYDFGPFEIRRFIRAKFKYQTRGPAIALAERLIDRKKFKRKEKKRG